MSEQKSGVQTVVTELTGRKKDRVYSYQAYVELLSR